MVISVVTKSSHIYFGALALSFCFDTDQDDISPPSLEKWPELEP